MAMTSSSGSASSMAWSVPRDDLPHPEPVPHTGLVAVELEESPGGPARKYYKLTPRGEECLA